jgi:hypothetical protein
LLTRSRGNSRSDSVEKEIAAEALGGDFVKL